MHLLQLYSDRGLTVVKGEKQYIWDDKGNKYLDAHTGHGVAFLGHRNPFVVEYLKRQIDQIMVLSPTFNTPIREEALQRLAHILPSKLTYIYLLNSGTEAVEFSLKIVFKNTQRRKIVAVKGCFHGRTFGSLMLTWNPKYKKQFEPLGKLFETVYLRPNAVEDIDKVLSENVAAVYFEPVLGEGGVIPLNREFVKELFSRAREIGAYVVVDEIQTGFGRTGRLWAIEEFGIEPDILLAGKAIGGGYPVSLVAVRSELANNIKPGDHGSTYGSNPLAFAAVAGATRALLEDNVVEKAAKIGKVLIKRLFEELGNTRFVREIRGVGLMVGIELRKEPTPVLRCLQEKHRVIALKAGSTVLRLLPPYMINLEDVERVVEGVKRCLSY
ncbi:MAG TPA: aspartate aminotransferase family protein [Pyrodictium sp.]|nr:aspartate aminotransferase family protein [Pyrodictium sp.]HIQ55564.1 aspartate aminotransferase family protein [Pyrodictium sp.]